MINAGIDNLIKWLDLNSIETWCIATSSDKQSNCNVFRTDEEQSREQNINRMREILALCDNRVLYITGKKGGVKCNVGNFAETWSNTTVQPQQQTVGAISGMYDRATLDEKIADAVARTTFEFEKKRFDEERQALAQERKELRQEREDFIGKLASNPIVVNGLQAIANAFASHRISAQVAGTGDEPVEVPAMRAKQQEQVETIEPEEAAEESVFTDEEADKLLALMERFKAVEPKYLELIEAVVTMAEKGDSTYTMAKGFLIK